MIFQIINIVILTFLYKSHRPCRLTYDSKLDRCAIVSCGVHSGTSENTFGFIFHSNLAGLCILCYSLMSRPQSKLTLFFQLRKDFDNFISPLIQRSSKSHSSRKKDRLNVPFYRSEIFFISISVMSLSILDKNR